MKKLLIVFLYAFSEALVKSGKDYAIDTIDDDGNNILVRTRRSYDRYTGRISSKNLGVK